MSPVLFDAGIRTEVYITKCQSYNDTYLIPSVLILILVIILKQDNKGNDNFGKISFPKINTKKNLFVYRYFEKNLYIVYIICISPR